ncbi:hypothetical protein ASPWEDRAFT_170504 [Aspergillus wentii DTO 134E9]|uniref:Arrestin-like N-terminal domain-containing protein n=1 Tax=Aspergillus wentii DTO 134E9 TaxID=1073089 RepID=A0A1L9RQB3_ASPWE|nr:uncharacterized protein ASPWEDRAFT_170504 [Aspergillus wentii DTO 134E9]OJJ37007.1 hypothetical protein ASPWEDRAFT_170504 [Aspergillus wentii DTO 134E9]
MLSRVERFLDSPSRIDLRVQLDREQAVYTNEDAVSGHIILRNEAQVDVAAITVTLSGSATSRLRSGKLTESHQVTILNSFKGPLVFDSARQLFKRVEQVFPLNPGSSWFTNSRAMSLGPGEYTFSFSIRVCTAPLTICLGSVYLTSGIFQFPQVSECYKGSSASHDKRPTNRRRHHLLRKLPPSTGDSSTPGEIKYLLEATVRQDSLLSGTQKVVESPVPSIARVSFSAS